VWSHFGTPFVGNYDVVSGHRWWEDPGYSTLSYYLRFGRVLSDPYFSAFHGYGDGFYSTLWGDGMWGGVQGRIYRPPWNYDLMAAGYLLALIPSLAILIGAVAAVVQLVRQPRAELFLLLGLPFAFGAAAAYQYLRFPYYGHAKAIYALAAGVSLASFAAWGFGILTRRWRVAPYLLGVMFGTWALTSFASFWVRGDSAATQAWKGARYYYLGRVPDAIKYFTNALQTDRNNITARMELGRLYLETGQSGQSAPQESARLLAKASEELRKALLGNRDNAHVLTLLARIAAATGRTDEALQELRHAVQAEPDYPVAPYILGVLLERKGLRTEAIQAYRQALGVVRLSTPNIKLYGALASSLAWILATSDEPKLRDAAQALDIAKRACEFTENQDAGCLSALGAAYAELGHYQEAENVLGQALPLARASGKGTLVTRIEKQLRLSKAGRPYREKPQEKSGTAK
jgi:tetratricopeptide (TPR) repeat protein